LQAREFGDSLRTVFLLLRLALKARVRSLLQSVTDGAFYLDGENCDADAAEIILLRVMAVYRVFLVHCLSMLDAFVARRDGIVSPVKMGFDAVGLAANEFIGGMICATFQSPALLHLGKAVGDLHGSIGRHAGVGMQGREAFLSRDVGDPFAVVARSLCLRLGCDDLPGEMAVSSALGRSTVQFLNGMLRGVLDLSRDDLVATILGEFPGEDGETKAYAVEA
jgi:hypothetical protein